MSYVCAECQTPQPPRTPQKTIVVSTRPRVYEDGYDEDGKLKVSRGEEIEREAKVCPPCYTLLRALQWARQDGVALAETVRMPLPAAASVGPRK